MARNVFLEVKNDDVVKEINKTSHGEVFGAGMALRSLSMMEAMARSHQTRKWEKV